MWQNSPSILRENSEIQFLLILIGPFSKKNRYGHEHNLFGTNEENSRRGQGAAKRKGKKKAPARQRVQGVFPLTKTTTRTQNTKKCKRTQKYIASDNCQRARPVTAYSLPRSVGKQVSVDILDGILLVVCLYLEGAFFLPFLFAAPCPLRLFSSFVTNKLCSWP